jgi:hypothetical protein
MPNASTLSAAKIAAGLFLGALSWSAALGQAPERPEPPGPYARRVAPTAAAKASFRKDQPIVGTYYFYWYDAETKEHFVDPDGSDALTDHPERTDGYSYRSAEWHRRELLDMIEAGLDFVLPVCWGCPGAHSEWSFTGIPPLVEAARRLESEGRRPPRIGLFYDTTTLRWNHRGLHADLSTREGKEWFYVSVRDFYAMVPPDLRACVDGRPLVWLYSASFAKRQDPAAFDYLREEFEKDFGVEPFIVKESSWEGRADAAYAWGAALSPKLVDVAAVGPGYDHAAVPGRAPLVRDREGGAFYSRSWDLVLSRDPARRPSIAVVETWNEFHEGTEIAPTREHGRKYLELTKRYAALWHQQARVERAGPYAGAEEVEVALGEENRCEGLSQAEHDDGRTEPVTAGGNSARRTARTSGAGRYIYFDVDDSFFWDDARPLELEVTYLDAGRGEVALDYDSRDPKATLGGAFKRAVAGTLEGTGAWVTRRVLLGDAAFTGRANGHDFRLSVPGGDLAVHRAVVRRKRSALVLARAGATEYAVVVAPDAAAPEKHAARELARFLGEVSGAEFQVREEVPAELQGAPRLLVGPGACRGVIPTEESERLGPEAYVIRTRGPILAIAGGRPRGTLYGVYSFLEDELGCRWFTPEVSRIPKREVLEVPELERLFAPKLEYRATDYPNSRDADWAVRNKLNGTQTRLDAARGGKVAYGPFVHTFQSILDPDRHFDAHPEYFSEVGGKRLRQRSQLCLTNPDVLRAAVETVRRWMREQPEAAIFSVSQNDWQNYCTCKECAKVIADEGSPAGPYIRFVNAVAEALREEFPGKSVDTLAYQFTRRPPAKTAPRPDVVVRLCSIECCFSHPLSVDAGTDPENAAFAEDLRGWSKVAKRLYVWDYVIDYAHSVMPFPNLYSLRPNIRFFIENGVQGVYEEANYFSKGGELAELRTWIIAKTLWDPEYDTDRAIDEFLAGYYEGAAEPLRRYIDLIHSEARSQGVHFRIFDGPKSPLFAADVLSRAESLFDEAEKAVAAKPEVLHRVQVARLPVSYVRIARLLEQLRQPAGPSEADRETLKALFESFDAVARKEGISRISEGRSYEDWASRVRREAAPDALEPKR